MANENVNTQIVLDPTDIYNLFDNFIEKTIINKKSFFKDNETEIFNEKTLSKIIDCYIKNPIGNENTGKTLVDKVDKDNEQTDSNVMNIKAYNLLNKLREKAPQKTSLTFFDKIKEQFKNATEEAKELFAHLIWLRYLPIKDASQSTKLKKINDFLEDAKQDTKKQIDTSENKINFPSPLASYGMAQQQLDKEMVHLVCLFSYLFSKQLNDKDQVKGQIKEWIFADKECKTNFIKEQDRKKLWETRIGISKDQEDKTKISKPLPIHNMLLHLCDKENFEPIAIQTHKESIVKNLYPEYLGKDKWNDIKDKKYTNLNEIDKYINEIKGKIKEKIQDFKSFWDEPILEKWKGGYVANAFEILTQYQKQIIFYGAPGTGKTYHAKELVKEFINANGEYIQTGNFVENELNDFKFKIENRKAAAEVEKDKKKIDLDSSLKDKKVIWEIVQFNQSFSYEDFIEGMRPELNGNLTFVDGIFKRFANVAKQNPEKSFILIIDEINRGKIDKIFGELLYLLEYRNESLKLHYTGEDFSIPENLYIVGTMNTADKSIALLDVALRRRFWFVRCEPQEDVLKEKYDISGDFKINNEDTGANVKKIAIKLFNLLNGDKGILEGLGDDASELKIGHSYFLKLLKKDSDGKEIEPTFSDLKNIWFYSIIPLLEEYCSFNKSMLSKILTIAKNNDKDDLDKKSAKIDLSIKQEFSLDNLKSIKKWN